MSEQPTQSFPKHNSSRFELELEFVILLGSPFYLNYLASQKYFQDAAFVAYLQYLQYWFRPEYIAYLEYPNASIKALTLLQSEQFRKEILSPDAMRQLATNWMDETMKGEVPKS